MPIQSERRRVKAELAGDFRRFTIPAQAGFEQFKTAVCEKFNLEPEENLLIKYPDSDGDFVTIGDDSDLETAYLADHSSKLSVKLVKMEKTMETGIAPPTVSDAEDDEKDEAPAIEVLPLPVTTRPFTFYLKRRSRTPLELHADIEILSLLGMESLSKELMEAELNKWTLHDLLESGLVHPIMVVQSATAAGVPPPKACRRHLRLIRRSSQIQGHTKTKTSRSYHCRRHHGPKHRISGHHGPGRHFVIGVCHKCKLDGCEEMVLFDSASGRVHDFCCESHSQIARDHGSHPPTLKGQQESHGPGHHGCRRTPSWMKHLPPHAVQRIGGMRRPGGCHMNRQRRKARFVKEVTAAPKPCSPNQVFTQTWRVRNDADAPWPAHCDLLRVGGDHDVTEIEIPPVSGGVAPGESMDVSVKIQAPAMPGSYQMFYRLAEANGVRFGQRLWCDVTVASASSGSDPEETTPSNRPSHAMDTAPIRQEEEEQQLDQDIVVVEDVSADTDFVNELQMLSQMGFSDIGINTQLLRDFNGDVNLVADHQLSEN